MVYTRVIASLYTQVVYTRVIASLYTQVVYTRVIASLVYPGGVYPDYSLPGIPWWCIYPGYASLLH